MSIVESKCVRKTAGVVIGEVCETATKSTLIESNSERCFYPQSPEPIEVN